jgi:EmrB/QacA subfamily drug resistance transporter
VTATADRPTVTPPVPRQTAYAATLSRKRIVLTTIAVMSGMFLASLDGTIVATAMPTVIGDLHGIDSYAWVFSAYLLAEVATIPLWGKFADMFGRKRIFILGMIIFLLGSALAGMSQTMTELVIFRAVQGLGAGCLIPVAQTISADLFTLEQRVKIIALYSAMFGVSAVIGPFVGGFLTDQLSWRWVFYVNIPFGIAAALLVWFALIEPMQQRRHHSIDWLGIVTLVGFSLLLLFALEAGGREYAWGSPLIVGCLLTAAALFVGFVVVERRAREPLLPLDLFKNRIILSASVSSILMGMTMFGVVAFLPLFAQVVLESSATDAGRILTPLMIGFALASFVGRWVMLRLGYRRMMIIGSSVSTIGLFGLLFLDVDSTSLEVGRDMFLIGLGLGMVVMSCTLAAQNAVTHSQMGVATANVNFTRQMGGAIGVAVAGAVLLNSLAGRLADAFPGAGVEAGDILAPGGSGSSVPQGSGDALREAFAASLHQVFIVSLVVGVLGLCATLLMPKGKPAEMRIQPELDLADEMPPLS